jgi:hypothetical protein
VIDQQILAETDQPLRKRRSWHSLKKTRSHLFVDPALKPTKNSMDKSSLSSPVKAAIEDKALFVVTHEIRSKVPSDDASRSRRILNKPSREVKPGVTQRLPSTESDFLKVDPMSRHAKASGIVSGRKSKSQPPVAMRAYTSKSGSAQQNPGIVHVPAERPKSSASRPSSANPSIKSTPEQRTDHWSKHDTSTTSSIRSDSWSRAHAEATVEQGGSSSRRKDHRRRSEPQPYRHDANRVHPSVPVPAQVNHGDESQTPSFPFKDSGNSHIPERRYSQQSHERVWTNRPYQRSSRHDSRPVLQEQNPPYRVLHSYNSPAYRGVPIWN